MTNDSASPLLLLAAAFAGALLAIATFSFMVAHTPLVTTADADPLSTLAQAPRLVTCVDSDGRSGLFHSEAAAVVAGPVQRVEMAYEGGCIRPNYISVRAGMPLELHFGAGVQQASTMQFEGVEVVEDLDADALVISPLEPGMYPFSCVPGRVDGMIVAR